jgi:hypothetical protein
VSGFASSNPEPGSERMSLRKLVEDPGLRSRAQTRISFFSSDEYNASNLLRGSLARRPTIVEVLSTRLAFLPSWLGVVATTRGERDVLNQLRGLSIAGKS